MTPCFPVKCVAVNHQQMDVAFFEPSYPRRNHSRSLNKSPTQTSLCLHKKKKFPDNFLVDLLASQPAFNKERILVFRLKRTP